MSNEVSAVTIPLHRNLEEIISLLDPTMVKTLDQQLEELETLSDAIEKELQKPKEKRDDYLIMSMIEKFRHLRNYIDSLR